MLTLYGGGSCDAVAAVSAKTIVPITAARNKHMAAFTRFLSKSELVRAIRPESDDLIDNGAAAHYRDGSEELKPGRHWRLRTGIACESRNDEAQNEKYRCEKSDA
jgi:hypothetical protein